MNIMMFIWVVGLIATSVCVGINIVTHQTQAIIFGIILIIGWSFLILTQRGF